MEEQKNHENSNQPIDLSKSFDDVVEKRKQNEYNKSADIDLKKSRKKKIYLIIIIVGWILIISIALSAWSSNQKKKQQIEKARQDIQNNIRPNIPARPVQ